jgi:predicted transcriptional regulator of viral defense system
MKVNNKINKKIMQIGKQNGGIIKTADIVAAKIPKTYLKLMTEAGQISRIAHGIYQTDDVFADDFVILQSRYKKGIFSHNTALFLHNITDRTPVRYQMTFPLHYNTKKIDDIVAPIRSINKLYKLGITNARTPSGAIVEAYNIERTLCDIVRGRNGEEIAIVAQAFKIYGSSKNKNLPLLAEYANFLRVTKKVRSYMEVLL